MIRQIVLTLIGIMTLSAYAASSKPCVASEYRQFDFWVGDWDAFDVGSPTRVARTQVSRLLDGCVVREEYEGTNGLKGQSFSIYDASRRLWHQSWVTNRGQLLVIEGKMESGEMVLSGSITPLAIKLFSAALGSL